MLVNPHRTLYRIGYDIVIADLRSKRDVIIQQIKRAEEGMREAQKREAKMDAGLAEYGPPIEN